MRSWFGRTGLFAREVRVPTRLQFQTTECGVAALAMVMAHHGLHVTNEELRAVTGVSRDCVNAATMAQAARHYGFECKAYSREPNQLDELPLPILVHLRFIHFVVVEGLSERYVFTNDPSTGRNRIPVEKFAQDFTGVVLALKPGADFKARGRPGRPVVSLWRRMDGQTRWFAKRALVAGVFAALAIPAFALVLGEWTEAMALQAEAGASRTFALGLVLVFVAVARAALHGTQARSLDLLREQLAITQTRLLGRHVASLSEGFFAYRLPSRIHHVLYSSESVARGLCHDVLPSLLALVSSLVALASLSLVNPGVGAFTTLMIVGGAMAIATVFHLEGDVIRQRRASADDQLEALLFGKDELERASFGGKDQDFVVSRLGAQAKFQLAAQESGQVEALGASLATAVGFCAVAAALWPAVTGDTANAGGTITAVILAVAAAWPLRRMLHLCASWDALEHLLLRIEDVLAYPEVWPAPGGRERSSRTDALERAELSGDVGLQARGLTFGYSTTKAPLIQDVDVTLGRGEQLGLTGPSGGGKSTLAALLSGSLKAWSGRVELQETDDQRGRRIACVDKSSFFFEGTVRDNLCLWRTDIPEEALRRAIEDAGLNDVLSSREGGLDAPVQLRGRNFSGGQRQRLEIARALLSDPTVLVLDEATDALDPSLEARVRANVKKRGCALIMVSHRASTLAACDRVLRIVGGRIAPFDPEANLEMAALQGPEEPAGPPVITTKTEPLRVRPRNLDAALRYIARVLGSRLSEATVAESESEPADISTLARRFGLRARRVRFVVNEWWGRANLPLLVSRRDAGEALVMVHGGRASLLLDPISAKTSPLAHAELEGAAYRLYAEPKVDGGNVWTCIVRAATLHWREFAVAQGVTLLLALALLGLPALAMTAPGRGPGATPSVLATALGLAALALAAGCLEYSRAIAVRRSCGQVELGVMAEFTLRLVRLKSVLVTHLPVDDLARGLSGLQRVIGNLQDAPVRQWLDVAVVVGALGFLFLINGALALIATALAIFGAVLPVLLSRSGRAQESGHERARLTSRRFLFDVLSGFSRLRLLNSGQAGIERWLERQKRDVHRGQRVDGVDARLSWLHETYPWMSLAALALGVTSLNDGVSTAALLSIAVLWGPLMEGALGLGAAGVAVLRSTPWARDADILATLSLEPLATGETASRQPIEIRDVSYRYRGSSTLSLDGVSLRIEPGEFIAITGPSGGGKSTLLRLIVGIDRPESGEIFVGSAGVGESERILWRRTVGMVSQDERVEYASTIRSQISGLGTYDVGDVWQAARLTLLADDITRMPMGLQTIVETGKVSTGQEQRLLIAREVVRRLSVLILDEATNAIPDALQAELFGNLRRLGLTCILVTHRETAIALMDRVVVMERGRVAWSGTPAQITTRTDLVEMLRAERLEGHQ